MPADIPWRHHDAKPQVISVSGWDTDREGTEKASKRSGIFIFNHDLKDFWLFTLVIFGDFYDRIVSPIRIFMSQLIWRGSSQSSDIIL